MIVEILYWIKEIAPFIVLILLAIALQDFRRAYTSSKQRVLGRLEQVEIRTSSIASAVLEQHSRLSSLERLNKPTNPNKTEEK